MRSPVLPAAIAAMSFAMPDASLAQDSRSSQADCAALTDSAQRLECYDARQGASVEEFGSVSGRISTYSINGRSGVLPTKVYLIPLPLMESTKDDLRKGSLLAMYPFIDGMKEGQAAPNGDFRISRVAAGRYLVVIISDAFSMQASGVGCERLSEGALTPDSGPGYVTRCTTTEVFGGEETSVFMTLRGRG